jgi:hypothetical protein
MNTSGILLMNTSCSLAPEQLLGKWHEQQPRNQSGLDLSETGEVATVYYMWVDLLVISFLYYRT